MSLLLYLVRFDLNSTYLNNTLKSSISGIQKSKPAPIGLRPFTITVIRGANF